MANFSPYQDRTNPTLQGYVPGPPSGETRAIWDEFSKIQTAIQSTDNREILADVATLESQVAARLPLAGGTMTGPITLHAAPAASGHAATKAYVDATPSTRISTGVATWGSTSYSPGSTREAFFDLAIPTGTTDIIGSTFCRAYTTGTYATGAYEVAIYTSTGTLVTECGYGFLTVRAATSEFGSMGFPFSYSGAALGAGHVLRFFVKNNDAGTSDHLVLQYLGHALFVT